MNYAIGLKRFSNETFTLKKFYVVEPFESEPYFTWILFFKLL